MSVGPVPDIAGGVVVAPLGAASCPSGVVGPGGDDRRRLWALDGSPPPSCGSGNGGGPGDGAGCGCSGAGGGSNGPMPWQWDFHALGGGGSGVRYPDQAGA